MSKDGKIDDVGVDEVDDAEESMLITLMKCMQQTLVVMMVRVPLVGMQLWMTNMLMMAF